MNSWHATILGLRQLPRAITAFEFRVLFQFSAGELRVGAGSFPTRTCVNASRWP